MGQTVRWKLGQIISTVLSEIDGHIVKIGYQKLSNIEYRTLIGFSSGSNIGY